MNHPEKIDCGAFGKAGFYSFTVKAGIVFIRGLC